MDSSLRSHYPTQEAPHRALQCSDILHEIFQHLYSLRFGEAKHLQYTLAQTARVSKLFSQHALDFLWKEIPSERTALNILPSFKAICEPIRSDQLMETWWPSVAMLEQWTYVRIFHSRSVDISCVLKFVLSQSIGREPTLDELDRLRQYTVRVRKVFLREKDQRNTRSQTIRHILGLLGEPLFPNLVSLVWENFEATCESTVVEILSCIATATLRHLRLNHFSSSPQQDEFERALLAASSILISKSPDIRHVELRGTSWNVSYAAPLISSLKALDVLSLYPPVHPQQAIALLEAGHDMTSLSLNLLSYHPTEAWPSSRICFRNLHRLCVTGDPLVVSRILGTSEWPAVRILKAIIIKANKSSPPQHKMLQCLESIARAFSNSLWQVSLATRFTSDMTLKQILWPLRDLHLLRVIDINLPKVPPCSSNDFRETGFAWPKLEEFHLTGIWTPDFDQGLQAVLELASVCPQLCIVNLPAMRLVPASELNTYNLSSHGLEHVYFHGSLRDKPYNDDFGPDEMWQLAILFESIFPKLQLGESCTPKGKSLQQDWKRLLEDMSSVRRRECNS
ncbi:uncharacterized protein FIBRA_00348 [Fibroporia radiculosa]|uniref:F-box domain-containing protein n=1 Tax=Fibroporia radiculosa TaxID=599839 RepID=J7SCR5_9APHY|nr:uncharacterized protein FIBRA_00348 [Fibroporia radiculosa]CCL98353.1 predicted protein [Fibroporia radiculosa]